MIWEWIGIIMVIIGTIVIVIKNDKDSVTVMLAVMIFFGFLTAIVFVKDSTKGEPITSIETGDYSIVSYAETAFGDKPTYQMILKQNNKIEFYALPKNMVTIDKSNGKPGTLEVIEKAGSKKAIMRP